jgi:hypothetical protein
MNFPFRIGRRRPPTLPPPKIHRPPLKASWSRDPRSGRLSQSWRSTDDGKGSCTGRPARPPACRLAA